MPISHRHYVVALKYISKVDRWKLLNILCLLGGFIPCNLGMMGPLMG